jgi:hypothetical protein
MGHVFSVTLNGVMDVTKPYKFIGFGAMDVTKPYKLIYVLSVTLKHVYFVLCNIASGPTIGLPGLILDGLLPGKNRNRPSGRPWPEGRFWCFPGSNPSKMRPGRPISGPEPLLRNIEYILVASMLKVLSWV